MYLLIICRVAEEVSRLVPELIARLDADLAHIGGSPATRSWPDYGEIVLVSSREEAVRLSDRYAPEHLEVQAEDKEEAGGEQPGKENSWLGEKLEERNHNNSLRRVALRNISNKVTLTSASNIAI